ncbi:DNA-directed RNA polymerase II subunit RPB1, partial [Dictyocoela roeselum]
NILKKIPEEDSLLMGFDLKYSRPEWMLITVLLVPPPAVRPSIVMEGVLRSEDDLTHKLSDIIKANNNLQRYEMEGAPPHIIRDYEQLLQFHVATFMNNDISGQPQSLQKTGRPLKSLSARLKGKEGRIRGNLMGKRVDFSARTVITPDPNIGLNEVGVPIQIAMVHTFPEKVTAYNLEKLTDLVRNGPGLHPGANYVTRADNTKIDLRFCRD